MQVFVRRIIKKQKPAELKVNLPATARINKLSSRKD
jgi:hypothetical protein